MYNVRARIFILAGFFLLSDRWLKWLAITAWRRPAPLSRFFGWEPFFNPGIAFSIPLPLWLTILVTTPVVALLLHHIFFSRLSLAQAAGFIFIVAGALSNLADRLMYRQTIDYLRVFTGVINVADLLIAVGLLIFVLGTRRGGKPDGAEQGT